MARISFPDAGLGEYADWMVVRPEIAAGMSGFSEAVYTQSKLDVKVREAARYAIALINDCQVCRAARAKDGDEVGIDEGFYAEVPSWRTSTALSPRERLAAEFAERFCIDHLAMDDQFWTRLRAEFADDEVADLTMCCAAWLGMGRAMAVIGVRAPDEPLLV
jgi:alkylhydroperoxidase family enzyme